MDNERVNFNKVGIPLALTKSTHEDSDIMEQQLKQKHNSSWRRPNLDTAPIVKYSKHICWDWKCIILMLTLLMILVCILIYDVVFRRPLLDVSKNENMQSHPIDTSNQTMSLYDLEEEDELDQWSPPVVEEIEWTPGQEIPNSSEAQDIEKLLVQVSGSNAITGKGAQNDAAIWIISKDPLHLVAGISSTQDKRLVQRYVMVVVHIALDGNSWTYGSENNTSTDYTSWLSESHECNWKGVLCNSNDEVTKIDLNGMHLEGTIPQEISYLTELKTFDLYRNRIYGRIPDVPSSLEYVDLERNKLSGPIPESLFYAKNLVKIYLSENNLSGTLSTRIGNLENLVDFRIWSNRLQGEIPTQVGALQNLSKFLANDEALIPVRRSHIQYFY